MKYSTQDNADAGNFDYCQLPYGTLFRHKADDLFAEHGYLIKAFNTLVSLKNPYNTWPEESADSVKFRVAPKGTKVTLEQD